MLVLKKKKEEKKEILQELLEHSFFLISTLIAIVQLHDSKLTSQHCVRNKELKNQPNTKVTKLYFFFFFFDHWALLVSFLNCFILYIFYTLIF